MYVNKCIKCGREFETKNPKRVICPDCLYPDKKMAVSSSTEIKHVIIGLKDSIIKAVTVAQITIITEIITIVSLIIVKAVIIDRIITITDRVVIKIVLSKVILIVKEVSKIEDLNKAALIEVLNVLLKIGLQNNYLLAENS